MRCTNPIGFSRRTAILAGAACAIAAKHPTRVPKRVLFVCLHGTVKSPIAREILRGRAKARNIAVTARSRGIEPAEGATAEVAAALVRDGIKVKRDRLRGLSAADTRWADVVVHFDPLPVEPRGKQTRDWSDTPSVNRDYAVAMAAIRARIEGLLEELAA